MKTKTMLDKFSTAIERVVKDLQTGASTRKRMRLGDFVSYALAQIEKAAKEKPEMAKQRLSALKRSVDDVLARMAKLSLEDTGSEDVDVEVTTAFTPTRTDGDEPMEDVTTGGDQSSSERSPLAIEAAPRNTAFATNLDEVAKALKALKADLGLLTERTVHTPTKKGGGSRPSAGSHDGERGGDPDRDRVDDADRAGDGGDADGWPLDLAGDTFLKGDAATESGPVWGYDPGAVAQPKAG